MIHADPAAAVEGFSEAGALAHGQTPARRRLKVETLDSRPGSFECLLDLARVARLARDCEDTIARTDPKLLSDVPVDEYIYQISLYPRVGSYRHTSPGVRARCDNVRSRGGPVLLANYHRLLLLRLIELAPARLGRAGVSADIRLRTEANLARIVAAIAKETDAGWYDYGADRFFKRLAISDLRLVPTGPVKVHLDTLSLCGCVRNPLAWVRVLKALRGWSPYYHMHTDSSDLRSMSEFHPEGWKLFYGRVANMLAANEDVLGIFGISWFFDPLLCDNSPWLGYLRTVPVENGASLIRFGPSASAAHDATVRSPTRRRLVAQGQYRPIDYALVWPRATLIEWAQRYGFS